MIAAWLATRIGMGYLYDAIVRNEPVERTYVDQIIGLVDLAGG